MKNKQLIRFTIFFALVLIALISLIFIFSDNFSINPGKGNELPDNYVINVIDGDTFQINSGEIIRLLCVDTPEKSQEGHQEAKEFLEFLILNKEAILEHSITDKDNYSRLLRYVYVNDSYSSELLFVNRMILNKGYGTLFIVPPETCNEMN